MLWNWQLHNWPKFSYNYELIFRQERQYLFNLGKSFAFLKSVEKEDYNHFVVEILSQEGIKSSQIEGEILDRDSLQFSIKKHFGLQTDKKLRSRRSGYFFLKTYLKFNLLTLFKNDPN